MKNKNTSLPFLTERSLGPILEQIYPDCKITPQFKYKGKRYDYAIKMNRKYKNLPQTVSAAFALQEMYDDSPTDRPIILLVEYDGNFHYMKNELAMAETGCVWEEIDYSSFLLRIPYFVQLDARVADRYFNTPVDFSNGFPHGFISKKCVMPNRFCFAGEMRIVRELKNLPPDIASEVAESLLVKIRKNGHNKICSLFLFSFLVFLYDKTRWNKVQEYWNKGEKYFERLYYKAPEGYKPEHKEYDKDLIIKTLGDLDQGGVGSLIVGLATDFAELK